MNNISSRLIPLSLTIIALVGGSAVRVQAAPDTEFPTTSNKTDLGNIPYEKRDEFTSAVNSQVVRLDARITELGTRRTSEPVSEPRRQAMEAMKSARAELDEKVGAISQASAETWNSVRSQVLEALNRAESAYQRAASS
jgi:hypothetical protein